MNIKLEIPESFFKGEEICGYYVSPEIKKVWAVELDLLAEFSRVCEKYNLRWWVYWGSLLGAVRHGGFIPWDDDIDIIMMHEDYEKFCSVAEKELSYPYHLRSFYNDKSGKLQVIGKLLNEDTAMFEPLEAKMMKEGKTINYSQGIFIDIFSLYDVPKDEKTYMEAIRKANFWYIMAFKLNRYTDNYYPALKKWKRPFKAAIYYTLKFLGISLPYKKCLRKYGKITRSFSCPNSEFVTASWPMSREDFFKKVYKRSAFDDTVMLPFEMLKVPAPAQYEEMLSRMFGDWHKFEITHFHSHYYDAERSYKYYLENKTLPEER